jgi:hypothetical protein
MNKIYNLLERYTDLRLSTKFKRLIYNIFIPIFYILEYITYKHFWKNIVVTELLSNDEIVDFFDKNEFGYNGNKIYKQDLIESNEYFNRLTLEDSKHVIKKEYIDTLSELLKANIPFNIEEFITLIVTTELKIIKSNETNYRGRVYTVIIQFCRLFYLQKALVKLIYWCISVGLISISIKLFLHFNL